jgi:uncharacterized protein YjbI with pentapeptide repeats
VQAVANKRASVAAPLVPTAYEPMRDPVLEDDTEWRSVEATGDLTAVEADAVEITTSRLIDVRLSGARLERLRLTDVIFERRELSGAVLDGAVLTRVELHDCRLSGTVLTSAQLRDVHIRDCRADGLNLRMTKGERVRIERSDLHDADLYEASFPDAEILDCDLRGATVSKAMLRGTRLHGSQLDGVLGADGLSGAVIEPTQVIPLSHSLCAALGITIDDPDA